MIKDDRVVLVISLSILKDGVPRKLDMELGSPGPVSGINSL